MVPSDLAVRAARYSEEQAAEGDELIDLSLVAEDTRARTVISGAYYLRGDELTVRTVLTDAGEGKIITGLDPLMASTEDPISILEDLEEAVRATVATYLDPQLSTFDGLANAPPTYEAYETYLRGMEHFQQLDTDASSIRNRSSASLQKHVPWWHSAGSMRPWTYSTRAST